jgi:hypothetical protein
VIPADWMAVRQAPVAPRFALMVSGRRRAARNGFALEGLSSGRELQQRQGGRVLAVTGYLERSETSLAALTHPPGVCRRCKGCGRIAGLAGSGFPWKSPGDRATEFTNLTPCGAEPLHGSGRISPSPRCSVTDAQRKPQRPKCG